MKAVVVESLSVVSSQLWWVSPLAIISSASIGAYMANNAINTQRRVAKLKSTLDLILKSESDKYYQDIFSTFISESSGSRCLSDLLDAETSSQKESKQSINNYLNHNELIAISIKQDILDEIFYKKWMRTAYVRDFKRAVIFVLKSRQKEYGSKLSFVNFETLARKWATKAELEEIESSMDKYKASIPQ